MGFNPFMLKHNMENYEFRTLIILMQKVPSWITDRRNLKLGHHTSEFRGDESLCGATGATYGSGYADLESLFLRISSSVTGIASMLVGS